MRKIHLLVEGGGNNKAEQIKLREGFAGFFEELCEPPRPSRRLKIVACGSREATFDNFQRALQASPDDYVAMLVDSEGPLQAGETTTNPLWAHLKKTAKWNCPDGVDDARCFLMLECMESWMVADPENLAKYYGTRFNPKALPQTANVESVPKRTIQEALDDASKDTKKGRYLRNKASHGSDILAVIDPPTVRKNAPHCKRLFDILSEELGAKILDQ